MQLNAESRIFKNQDGSLILGIYVNNGILLYKDSAGRSIVRNGKGISIWMVSSKLLNI